MRFIFDWSDTEGWMVKDATIHPAVKSTSTDEDIFEGMKKELLYFPDNYGDLKENWRDIPVINHIDDSIYEPYNRFTQFAYITSRKLSSDSIIYASLTANEGLSYVYIRYENDKYYYLADYSRCPEKPYYISEDGYFQNVYVGGQFSATQYAHGSCFEHFYLTDEENLSNQDIFDRLLSSQGSGLDTHLVYSKKLDAEDIEEYSNLTGDYIEQGIKIIMPTNRSWIGEQHYKLEDGVVCGTYTDWHIDADMIIRAGKQEAVFEKSREGLEDNLADWEYETWGATTSDGEWVEIELYLEQLGATNFNTVVAKWEYEENTYLLYGDTESTDGSSVVKTAIHIIQNFEKHE